MKKRLAIITSHPIQYNAPLFKLLTKRALIDVKVFYSWGENVLQNKIDPGFGKVIQWDIPLLEGYDYEFLENTSKNQGSHHFNGIINPNIIASVLEFGPDVVLVYGWAFNSHLKAMRYFKHKTIVLFRGDSTLLDRLNPIKNLVRSLFLRSVYANVDYALYVGLNNYEYYLNAGMHEHRLIYAPHSVDNERFNLKSIDSKSLSFDLRKKMNIKEHDFVFLFSGKLEQKKDPLTLIKAFTDSNFDENVHLVLVGNGNLETKLKQISANQRCIHFLEFQNQTQMPFIYGMADVFVLPSSGPGETWGLSVNEAMANGKPVIVSNKCGCARDLVEPGVNGYTFEANNALDLSLKLKAIYALTEEEREKMKLRSLHIIEQFSLEKLALTIENTVVTKSKIL